MKSTETSRSVTLSFDAAPRRLSVANAAGTPMSVTAAIAEGAIQHVLERRARRRTNRDRRSLREPSMVEAGTAGIVAVVRGLQQQAGVPTWGIALALCTAVVVGTGALVGPWLFRAGPPCPVHPVVGRVDVGKAVPAGAQLVFHPVAGELPDLAVPRATVKDDGSFAVSTFGASDGAPEGEYVVTIQWFRMSKDGVPGPNVLPRTYSAPSASPVRVAIHPGRNQLEPIVIAR